MSGPGQILRAAQIDAAARDFVHSLQPAAACRITDLSRLAGHRGAGLNMVSVAPGGQAFPHHRHHAEDEWTFVVSGRAAVRLGDETHDLGPGDFVSFPAGGEAHSIRNASDTEPLVCLMGGSIVPADITDFPELGMRVTRSSAGLEVAETTAFGPFSFRTGARAAERAP
ncbi:cupin domain-containing protein [Limibaculum sp. FT325]|uniref:cupin domain-containing protein n=1 Tax=Thermohalobaculum sediminis TaxID=2939436 RepID=UPI0020C11976|nr:cupin domain-containing protein [Limibaculum sediminis]MCL5776472.1 cupin domain-containing protein [Limibaculum sediminis]